MTTAVSSPEEVCNLALDAVGYPEAIGDIYEGTKQARIALRIYAETRDEVLREQDWPFARGAGVTLALLKGPPPAGGYNPIQPWTTAFPPPPWLYEYAYPADCLDLLAIQYPPGALPSLYPMPATWRIDNDLTPVNGAGPPQQVILTNVASAMAVYRRRVTNPQLWQPDFVAVLVEALARKFAVPLGRSLQVEQAKGREGVLMASAADRRKG